MVLKNNDNRFAASNGALKVIYYVIIGIAITEALSRVLLKADIFVGAELIDQENRPSLFLLLAFLPTISRFVHGASIHLDGIQTGRFKALFDFVGFFLQALLFYVMALSLDQPRIYCLLFILMLLADTLWLFVLWIIPHIDFSRTQGQWIGSNIIIILTLAAVMWLPRCVSTIVLTTVVLCTSWIATFADYGMNADFYFPKDQTPVQNSTHAG